MATRNGLVKRIVHACPVLNAPETSIYSLLLNRVVGRWHAFLTVVLTKSVAGQSRGCGVSTAGFKYLHPKIMTTFQAGDICLQTEVVTCTRSCMFCGCS